MNNAKYVHLSANVVANIKQSYYDEIRNNETELNNSKIESNILKVLIIDIESELRNIKMAIKNTILRIKILDNNIDIEVDMINGLRQSINDNSYTNKNEIALLTTKINELERMKNELIKLEKIKKELINQKNDLKRDRKNAINNMKIINKNVISYEENIKSLNSLLIKVDDEAIYSNGYVKEKTLKPKLRRIIKLK